MAKSLSKLREKRSFARRMVNARVMLVNGSIGEVRATTRDISDNGVFVVVQPVPKLPVGAHIKMHMMDSLQPDIAFNMKVIRSTAEGIGMMFIDYEVAGQRFPMDALLNKLKK